MTSNGMYSLAVNVVAIVVAAAAQATIAARQYRLQREAALLKAQLAAARGERAVFPTEGPSEL